MGNCDGLRWWSRYIRFQPSPNIYSANVSPHGKTLTLALLACSAGIRVELLKLKFDDVKHVGAGDTTGSAALPAMIKRLMNNGE